MESQPTSRGLVLDDVGMPAQALKPFCDDRYLVLVKIVRERLMSALQSNVELGPRKTSGKSRKTRAAGSSRVNWKCSETSQRKE